MIQLAWGKYEYAIHWWRKWEQKAIDRMSDRIGRDYRKQLAEQTAHQPRFGEAFLAAYEQIEQQLLAEVTHGSSLFA